MISLNKRALFIYLSSKFSVKALFESVWLILILEHTAKFRWHKIDEHPALLVQRWKS